jgi:hypothetical protein
MSEMDKIFSTQRTLKIEKNGDRGFNDATDLLTYVVADLFIKAVEVDPESPEGSKLIQNFDYNKYDYKLQFSDSKNILISIKDNIAHFENDKTLYKFWGDTSKLWLAIKPDSTGKLDLAEGGLETMVKNYQQDIDGNGQKTDISLVYKASGKSDFKGDLILRIGDTQTTVYPGLLWQIRPRCIINNSPQIKFLSEKNKKNKVMIVYFSWIGNSFSQTGEVFAYNYENGSIKEVDFTAPEINFKYTGGDKFTALFPQINSSQEVRFNSKSFSRCIMSNTTLEEVLTKKIGFYHQPYSFIVNDYNGDGIEELCSMSSPMLESATKMSMGTQYTFYNFVSGKMEPFKVVMAPPVYGKEKTTLAEIDIIEMLFSYGSITIGDNGIENSWYQPSSEYSSKELTDTVNSLISRNVLKKDGKKIFFNF